MFRSFLSNTRRSLYQIKNFKKITNSSYSSCYKTFNFKILASFCGLVGSVSLVAYREDFISHNNNDSNNNYHDNMKSFILELSKELPEDQIDTDQRECKLRGKPWNSYHSLDVYPSVVVFPVSSCYYYHYLYNNIK